jgi:predicted RNA-binding Zn-ribbon protein involved in translation (DUF1610 family)
MNAKWSGERMSQLETVMGELGLRREDDDEDREAEELREEREIEKLDKIVHAQEEEIHTRKQAEAEVVACDVCGKIVTRQGLGAHRRMHKPKQKHFECPECGQSYINKPAIGAHLRNVHDIFGGWSGRRNRNPEEKVRERVEPAWNKGKSIEEQAEEGKGILAVERPGQAGGIASAQARNAVANVRGLPKLKVEESIWLLTDDEGHRYILERID